MKINWFTVIAQVVNFLILVWLLKKFLYKPILDAVNERENKITDELKTAAAEKETARKEQEAFKKKNEDFDRQKKALLDTALAEVTKEKQRLIAAAKETANALRSGMEKAAEEEQATKDKEAAEKTQVQVFALARKALSDIASADLEAQAINTFIKHLKAIKKEEKDLFIAAFKADATAIMVSSAFEVPLKQQHEITDTVAALLSAEAKLQFQIEPEVISGIELSTNGFKVAWSFSEYLNAVDKAISVASREQAKPKPKKQAHVIN